MLVPPPSAFSSSSLPQSSIAKRSVFSKTMLWLSDSLIFLREFFKHPRTLGTPFICSPFVATKLLSHVSCLDNEAPRNYLEAGAGPGVLSVYLAEKLRPIDKLYLVEIEPKFCEVLRSKFKDMKNVVVLEKGIQECAELKDHSFDVIVSTVPFNSLPSSTVLATILASYERLIKPNGIVSHLEYVGTSTANTMIRFGQAKKAYITLQKLKGDFFAKHVISRHIVMANLPPARVVHCKMASDTK